MKRETSISRRSLLVGTACAALGALTGCTAPEPTAAEPQPELILRYAENQPEDYPTTKAALAFAEMVSDMGAVPVQVVYSQVYAALHNGRIDGAENNWPSYEAMGHYEVAPYFLKNEHTRVPEIQIASRAALEKLAGLDSSFPGIVRGCARDSANVERRLWAEREAQAEEDMRAWGVEVTTLSEAEMQKFRAAVRPMYERFAEQAELIRQIQEA